MNVPIFCVICIISGIIGGMGMGGGTVFIPLVTLLLGFDQHLAQWLNLIAFIPMSVVSIIIHAKNKLILPKKAIYLCLFSVLTAVPFAFLAYRTEGGVLRKIFGFFIIVIGLLNLFSVFYKKTSHY